MGDDVVYSVDVHGVLFDSQQGAPDSICPPNRAITRKTSRLLLLRQERNIFSHNRVLFQLFQLIQTSKTLARKLLT
jgi:hypothetical protein